MKRKMFFYSVACAIGASCLYSCALEPYEEPAEETYTKQFIKTFGLIDPDQDWNMATRQTVTVNTGTATNVKVYAKTTGAYSLVGDYDDVQGQHTLGFDLSRNVSEVLVASGCQSYVVPVGGSVDFTQNSTTRTILSEGETAVGTLGNITVAASEKEHIFSEAKVLSYANTLVENEDNRSKVTANFHVSATEGSVTFTLFPTFWNTGHGSTTDDDIPNEIGIAYEGADGSIVRVPIYRTMEGDELSGANSEDATTWQPILGKKDSTYTYTSWGQTYTGTTQVAKQKSTQWDYDYYKSKGIKVTVPQGLYFGFYIKVYEGTSKNGTDSEGYVYNYSVADWNASPYYTTSQSKDKTKYEEGRKAVYVATFTDSDGNQYMAFEDWSEDLDGAPGDHDLNDFVVMFDPAPTILDDDRGTEWILAAEDLGNTDDFDFNDMVVKVKHMSGKAYVDVTALAAGGTLPAYLYYGNTQVGDEFHTWFGTDVPSTEMVNTTVVNKEGATVRVTTGTDFSMTNYGGVDQMGGFKFIVERTDGTSTEITAPKNGTAPQMMCLPETWQWPKERVNISTAYPQFGEWGANYTNTTWINSVDASKVLPVSTTTTTE